MLVFGGGGCGKTRIINLVMAKLFRRFYGPRGLVLTAFANKPARLIGGKTMHNLIKKRGGDVMNIPRLRIQNEKERRALTAVWAPVGALVKDEFTQQPGALEHALAVRSHYGRMRYHNLREGDYSRPQTSYGSMPYIVTAGDPLQFPPVPAASSLLSAADSMTKEHRIAVEMFQDQDYVCELKATMRFREDPVLTSILKKMRTPGEDRSQLRLTNEEWRLLQNTDVAYGASLRGTETWCQSAFGWAYVCMAQWNRSRESAKVAKETLFMLAARDSITNADSRDLIAVRDQVLRAPNMNLTGNLPAVLLLHVNMKVRCTVNVCRRQAPKDATGVVQHIELHQADRVRHQRESHQFFVLHHAPTVHVKSNSFDLLA